MKKCYVPVLLVLFLSIFHNVSKAQTTPFPVIEYIDINNIKAGVSVHGDVGYDPVDSSDACEFIKGSGKNIIGAASLWMSGYDPVAAIHVSAQTYRQHGNDYWPGPLGNTGTAISYASSQDWARVWKVTGADIISFKANPNSLPAAIFEWPGKGNIYAKGNNGVSLNVTTDMAPFC